MTELKSSRVVLVDPEGHTASMLADEFAARGFAQVEHVADAGRHWTSDAALKPDVVIFNYHADRPGSLDDCQAIRERAPQAAIVALASPGPALKAVRAWSARSGAIDAIVEKPLSYGRFFPLLDKLLEDRMAARALVSRASSLSSLLPEGALAAMGGRFDSEAEMFEAVVLFTDIRGSSQLIRSTPPRDFFRRLNRLLSANAKLVMRFEGSVVKYTGDGVMAVFRGMGKSYLALRCALELAADGPNHPELPFGIGVAEGLVLAGFIGDSEQAGQRRQYDVIGATANLSARLCGLAGPGEVVATSALNSVAKLESPCPRPIGRVSIKGFERDVDCVAFGPVTR